MKLALLLVVTTLIISVSSDGEDLYKLLGVARDATVKEIRKAFKGLAVKLHPDKNKDDPDADAKFIKLTHAYDVLKEPDSRKQYDLYGETTDRAQTKYHSYSYYRDQFGLYDDDPLIVTLSKADYEVNVLDKNQAWFINFYSPQCHHCHDLAPTWRKLAADLEGVVRVAAVNCEEDFVLCHQLSIEAYPTLLYYEKEAHMYEGERYRASKGFADLKRFVLSKLTVDVQKITKDAWSVSKGNQWLLFMCGSSGDCPELETQKKLAAILDGLMMVGVIEDETLSSEIYKDQTSVVFWQIGEDAKAHPITGSDSKEILDNVLDLLPNPVAITEVDFKEIRRKLRSDEEQPWLLCFYLGTATELNLQLKRLPTMISDIQIGLVHCGRSSSLCSSLHVSHYPAWGILKEGGAFELHHGRDVLYEVAAFARDSSASTNLHAISPADFHNIKEEGGAWFIDWYAPWCPPCRKLMPEMRRASQHFNPEQVKFGTIDCTLHTGLCNREGIRSYPTTVFYNGTKPKQHFHGTLSESGIVEFVDDMINPSVITLDSANFVKLMRKPESEMWLVDYYAPWCGPCQQLSTQWRIVAKQMKSFENVKIAQVDCVENSDLCSAQNIRSYPTIRLYPFDSKGLNSVAMYGGHRDALSLRNWIMSFLPTSVHALSSKDFRSKILNRNPMTPWLVDYYAPWCGPCLQFEPDFRMVSDKLEGIVNSGKVNCEIDRNFCIEMRVTSYPTVILYFNSQNWYHISSRNPEDIVARVKNLIEDNKNRILHDEF
ncbi:PREDICTED: dnaJ homolog subfamily C member 10-like [Nicrophorus vespilloides]|uniref:DnaJ homolog subfamily C member 10 n=1 Tax=Nicrophorus vespilloides TaxID=110193 RepID=A0ABM1MYD8_NICVS|nr:PREDICTED: dnaJ homolog subfamily C member 10-like [Nicrophorus vespilloides]